VTTSSPVRLLLVDDQDLIRDGLRMILDSQRDMEVVGEAGDADTAVAAAARLLPDVVLMDVRLPGSDGIEATRRILRARTTVRVLVLTTFDLDEYVYRALHAGASGFLLKSSPRGELLHAVRRVAAGSSAVDPTVVARLVAEFTRRPPPSSGVPDRLATLSERELEVLRLMAQGMSNAEVAGRVHLGQSTVKTHVASILRKLDLRDRVQAVIVAYESGLVRPGEQ
jgi:DNA-binding NarL/FixJ family response regulator